MAFTATKLSTEPRAVSIGPLKEQLFTYTAVSGDTSGTITADAMIDRVTHVMIDGGLALTAAPTFSGRTITLAFADPAADAFGSIVVRGI